MQANPDYKGVCHVALAQEGHCRPGEVFMTLMDLCGGSKDVGMLTAFVMNGDLIARILLDLQCKLCIVENCSRPLYL